MQADRAQVIAQIRSLSVEKRHFRTIMDKKRKEREPLQQALGKLRRATSGGRERGLTICSSEEELNNLVSTHTQILLNFSKCVSLNTFLLLLKLIR